MIMMMVCSVLFQDLLWRDLLVYKGCIDLDQCSVELLRDGRGWCLLIFDPCNS